MSLNRFHAVRTGPAAVSVHDKGNVLGNWTAAEGRDEGLAEMLEEGGDGREGEGPVAEVRAVRVGRHLSGGVAVFGEV